MDNSNQVFEQMAALWSDFQAAHDGETKKSQQSARKYIGELKKLVTEYRKLSVEENK